MGTQVQGTWGEGGRARRRAPAGRRRPVPGGRWQAPRHGGIAARPRRRRPVRRPLLCRVRCLRRIGGLRHRRLLRRELLLLLLRCRAMTCSELIRAATSQHQKTLPTIGAQMKCALRLGGRNI